MTIKEQLKGTCVLNEKEEMGAEIVALYTEAGFNNRYLMEGLDIDSYYGCDMNGDIKCTDEENTIFDKVLTLSQLRDIVSTPEYKEPIKWNFASELKEASQEMQDTFVKSNPEMKHSVEPCSQASKAIAEMGQDIDLVLKTRDKILEQKERFKALKESSIDSVKASVENIVSQSEEPQFKAGDVIIYETICGSPNGEIKDSAYGTYIQYYKDDRHIIEDQHGFITESNSIRHPKDKLREAAEKSSELQEGSYTPPHKETYIHGFIDGAKWGKENK